MLATFDEMRFSLFKHAKRLSSKYRDFSFWTLMSIGWLGCRKEKNPKFLSNLADWTMRNFIGVTRHKEKKRGELSIGDYEKTLEAPSDLPLVEDRDLLNYIMENTYLSPREKEIVYMRFYEDKSLKEIGKIHHLSPEQIRVILNDVLTRMRFFVKKEGLSL